MQVDITQLIAELLYEYDTVSIPKFGGLTTAYRAAEIDQVAGKLQPPTKELSFNENIVVNDGLLLGQLQERYELTQADAEVKLNLFVEQLKGRIDRGEEVSFQNLGKFYVGSDQAVKFVPNATNFNTDAYGLPEVKFYPVTKAGVKPAFEKVATPPPPKAVTTEKSGGNGLAWLIMILAALALAMIVYSNKDYIFPSSNENTAQESSRPGIRINESPEKNPNEAEALGEDELIVQGDDSRTEKEVTIGDGQREAVVVVGLYGKIGNARKAVERIYKMGYEAMTKEQNGSQLVSARFAYSDQEELERIHARLKRSFDKNARIVSK